MGRPLADADGALLRRRRRARRPPARRSSAGRSAATPVSGSARAFRRRGRRARARRPRLLASAKAASPAISRSAPTACSPASQGRLARPLEGRAAVPRRGERHAARRRHACAPRTARSRRRFSGTATDIVYENVTLESADITATARDLFRAPQIDGDFAVRNLKAGGLAIVSRRPARPQRQGEATAARRRRRLADGRAKLAGSLAPRDGGLAIALQSFAYSRPGIDLALAAPTTIVVEDGTARFDTTTLKAGGGSVDRSPAAPARRSTSPRR